MSVSPVQFGRQAASIPTTVPAFATWNEPLSSTPSLTQHPMSELIPQPSLGKRTASALWSALSYPIQHPFKTIEALALLELSIGRLKSMEHLPGAAKTAYSASKKVLFKA